MRSDPDHLIDILRDTVCASVRADAPDLSARQLALLLVVTSGRELTTVRGMAKLLAISKPAVSRSLDRLVEIGLAARAPDLRDGRSVLLVATEAGYAHVAMLRSLMNEVAGPLLRPAPAMRRALQVVPPLRAQIGAD